MSACKCCTNIYDIGCVYPCLEVELPLEALEEGDHRVLIEYRGTTHEYIQTVVYAGENIRIPYYFLNENYEHIVNVIDPNGDEMIYVDADVEYDCFKIRTQPTMVATQIEVRGEHYTPNE